MPGIGELIGQIQTREVLFRGQPLRLHAVTARTVGLLKQVYPRPVPPAVPDPSMGTGSGRFVSNEFDAGFVRELARWRETMRTAEIALAIDLEPQGCKRSGHAIDAAEDMRQWAYQAVDELGKVVTSIEMLFLGDAVDAMSGGKLEEAAKKD